MDKNQNNFFDPRLLLALLISMGFFYAWQSYITKKYPREQNPAEAVAATPSANEGPAAPKPEANSGGAVQNLSEVSKAVQKESILSLSYPNFSVEVSSIGMGLRKVVLQRYQDRKGSQIQLGSEIAPYSFSTALAGNKESLFFTLEKVNDTEVVGRAQNAKVEIEKRLKIDPANYSVRIQTQVRAKEGLVPAMSTVLTQSLSTTAEEPGLVEKVSFLAPPMDQDEVFFIHGDDARDRHFSVAKTPFSGKFERTQLASVSSLFFSLALVNQSRWSMDSEAKFDGLRGKPLVEITFKPDSGFSEGGFETLAYLGPKELNTLKNLDPKLSELVNFGFFGSLAKALVWILKGFFGIVGNWGVAIILMTLLVRVIVLPANLMSYKSMAAMQRIRPQMEKIQAKYKDDKAKQQQETMELFKKEKVNPLGGCLPALVQIPVFIALYQVLGHSIELYRAPFALWVADLSAKDPYFVLPVSMGIALYVQQKLTPSTMDPAQQKIMNIIPLIFTVPMLALPSGLSLYMCTSTLFGILQQLFFLRKYQPVSPSSKVLEAK